MTTIDTAPPVKVDRAKWEATARSLSALFRQTPEIYTSNVTFDAVNTTTRYLNSEGFSYTRSHSAITFDASAATQAPDGGQISDFVWLYARSLSELPSEQELSARLVALGKEVSELRSAQRMENYNGPVLFEDDAAVQAFRLAFVPDLVGMRRVISDMPNMQNQGGQAENPFLDKIGARVLPEFLSVLDNPTLAEFNRTRMAGFAKVDEDGLPTRETRLVEKGMLKTLLTSRDPVRGIEHSTGSRHAGQAAPTNIIVTADNGLSAADLRSKLMELVKQRNLPYGILVRRLRVLNTARDRQGVSRWPRRSDPRCAVRGLECSGVQGHRGRLEGPAHADRPVPSARDVPGVFIRRGRVYAIEPGRAVAAFRGPHDPQGARRNSQSSGREAPVFR